MKSANRRIAATPFPSTNLTVEVKRGMPQLKQVTELATLTVVFDTDDGQYLAGEKVLVRGELAKTEMARQVFGVQEQAFILIPYDLVVLKEPRPARQPDTAVVGAYEI